MIEAYVTNLGKYNEGELCGEWLKLPTTAEEVKALFSRIGVDGVLYEEFFITDYSTNLAGMQNLGEYESLDDLNYLAALVSELQDWELEKFEAAAVYGDHSGNVQELINLAQNLDCYEYYPGVSDNDDLGRYLIDELEYEQIPDNLVNYIDYEAYGRDFSINESGDFVDGGYISRNDVDFKKHYDGHDLPDEYKICFYPDPPDKMPIKQQLEMYSRMAQTSAVADKPAPKREERT